MNIIKRTDRGFAHPVLLAFLLVGVVTVIGYSGQRVLNRNRADQPASQTVQSPIVISGSEDDLLKGASLQTTEIKSGGTAAGAGAAAASPTKQVALSSDHNITTPIGTLGQLVFKLKTGQYSDALYFITPRFMNSAYSLISAQNVSEFEQNCRNSSACQTLLSYNVKISMDHITESPCSPPAGTVFNQCSTVTLMFKLEDGTLRSVYYKTVGYDVHAISATMLRGPESSNWVIDQIAVDDFKI